MKFIFLSVAWLLLALSAWAEEPATFPVGGFTFTRPADWKWVPVTKPMRKAELAVPGGEQSAEVTFFHFGPGGGDVKSNADRWFRQFQSAPDTQKTEEQTFGQTKVTFASTEGTFMSGMPGAGPATPMTDYALLGAILDHPDGLVFVKMTGPKALVQSAREKFVAFVKTAAEGQK